MAWFGQIFHGLCRQVLDGPPQLSPSPAPYREGTGRPISKKFCEKCNRLRLTADGKLLLCLHGSAYVDLKDILDDDKALDEAIQKAIAEKPKEHNINLGQIQQRDMNRIGG